MDLALIQGSRGTDLTFCLLMLCVVALGVLDGIVEGSFMGLAIYLPHVYYQVARFSSNGRTSILAAQGYMCGLGFSAVFSIVMRILAKAILAESADGLRLSAFLFFLSSAVMCLLCLLVQRFVIVPHPVFCDTSLTDLDTPLLGDSSTGRNTSIRKRLEDSNYIRIAKKMWIELALLILFNAVTYTIYPGVISDVECEVFGDWYGVMLVATFAVSDFLARLVPTSLTTTNRVKVTVAVVSMTTLVPITFVAVQSFPNPVVIFSLMLALGITDGYLNLCCFGMGQKAMEGAQESFLGGNILVLFSLVGMALGSVCSMIWGGVD